MAMINSLLNGFTAVKAFIKDITGLGNFKMFSNMEYAKMQSPVGADAGARGYSTSIALKKMMEEEYRIHLYQEVKRGESSYFYRLDQHMSGLCDQALMMRCETSLNNLGILTDERKDGYNVVMAKTKFLAISVQSVIDKLDRDTIKEVVIPHFYNGEFKAEEILGIEGAEKFQQAYAECFPKPEEFRLALKAAWRCQPVWQWELPDGYQVAIPSMSLPKEGKVVIDGRLYTYRFSEMTGRYTMYTNGKRVPGTLALCANVTHSVDAYVKREIIRRCHMTKARAEYILDICQNICDEQSPMTKRISRVIDMARKTGIVSVRLVYLLEKNPCKIPQDILEQLYTVCERLPSCEFGVLAVHDEFGCKIQYVNSMRIQANEVFASLYAGAMPEYINSVFGTKLVQGEFNMEHWMAIRNNNHLLRI